MTDIDKLKISVEVTKNETVIHVENISLSETTQFDEVYKAARRLLERIPLLNKNLESELIIEKGKLSTAHLWIEEENEFKLGKLPKIPEHRIALCLLRNFPLCIKEVDIVKETGVLQKTTNRHLRGERKSSEGFFSACDGGYTLTEAGINWVLDEIILNPEIQQGG